MLARIRWTDVAPALLVGVFQFVTARGVQYVQPDRVPTDTLGFALLAVGPLMVALRRFWTVPALVITTVVTCVYLLAGYPYGPPFAAPIVLLYTAVTLGHRRAAWLSAAGFTAFVLAYVTWIEPRPRPDLFHNLSVAAFVLLVLTVSEIVRVQRERLAERRRVSREELRRQASEERLTMAQELHDVLAHNISLIHVQASTALHLIDEHPEQARTALATIKQASKDVLGEMRSVISVLREDAPRSPTAGLDRLDELIERTGLDVTKSVRGEPRPVPPSVERAVFRIIQESLTNVTRHAPGAKVTVVLEYSARALAVRVADTGSPSPGPGALADAGSGNGLPGMRERAHALGGTLSAAPDGSGFTVSARLPLPEESN
ncbi:sensor histidine kinase [Spongiactinospora sp. TRM90649]|uniref:sensor histidine kinase n=1 Tax=Spongiactinospora sp. TRM90649 TaxID=3031114 RepID=UPI0023F695FE|nr:sensor histidine kinase [Spongiactinospora sp. TRM90649]MDF5751044.1 sensor histidine kinase [Spongiactinospora sp. TRM90649]